jgi:hypothetical protein
MKKLFFMLFSVALLASCSDDDDVNNKDDERIYGKWFVAEANNIPSFELSDCNQQSNIIFKADNTTSSEYYTSSEGECTIEDRTESTWSKNNDIYTFAIPFKDLGKLSGSVKFEENEKQFVFTPSDFPGFSIVFNRAPQSQN